MLRPKRGNRSNVENKGTIQSPFVKYCITVVSCTLICGVAFLFLMFGTDTIYQVNEDSIDTAQSFNRVSVSTVVDTIKQEDSLPPDNPELPGVTTTVIDVNNIDKSVYHYLTDVMGYTDETTAGIMGNLRLESGMNPQTTESHSHDGYGNAECTARGCTSTDAYNKAHGLAQWDGPNRVALITTAIDRNVEWNDLGYQLWFLDVCVREKEHVSPTDIMSNIPEGADAVEYATYKWCGYYERCAGTTYKQNGHTYIKGFDGRTDFSHWTDRLQYAQGYYATIQSGGFE